MSITDTAHGRKSPSAETHIFVPHPGWVPQSNWQPGVAGPEAVAQVREALEREEARA